MSTILDALKKVERDREVPRDELLDAELPDPRPRRGISTRVIVICASIGFAAGIGLALWRDTAPLQQASVPEPATQPAIDVPAPPLVPKAKREVKVATPPPPAAVPPAAANPVVANAAPQPSPNVQGVPSGDQALAAVPKPAAPVTVPAVVPPAVVPPAVAVDREASAVEPSPFTPEGGAPAAAAKPQAPPVRPGRKSPGRPTAARPVAPLAPAAPPAPAPPNTLAAVAPLVPAPPIIPAPAAVAPPPADTEPLQPAQPPAVVIDTGRSPPGTPRVSLTFLQWSVDPDRRFAFISIDGAPSQRVREGDTASGMTVSQITQTGVQFQREGQMFMIRPRH